MDDRLWDTVAAAGSAVMLGAVWGLLGLVVGVVAGPWIRRRFARRAPVKAAWPGATVHRVALARGPAALVQPGGVVGSGYQPALAVPLVRDRSVPPVVLDLPTSRLGAVRGRPAGGRR